MPVTFDNPLSGERITIRRPAAGADPLSWELTLAPGGAVPSRHAHPGQSERFTVLSGQLRLRVGRRRPVRLGPGQSALVPPGTVHHFANPAAVPAVVAVDTTPAGAMADLLEVAAAMARQQHAEGRRRPRLLELALFMDQFAAEVQAPYLPVVLVRAVVRPAAWLARRTGRRLPR